ncbi:MAG: aldolase/citrate lyase family protein [Candidatus Latescibacteria bacterium]|jgi:2-keto-3-deoxy-L-rhamnonate aldolase RhmA|nr:aldolase/citrate lyase family protein [Candidatus Latescibacterota bacterium]
MRKSKVATKLRSGQFARMASLGHVIPAFVKMAQQFGYDGIWLDLEHRAMSDREVQMLLAYAHAVDVDIMIRTPTLEKTRLYRYLEDGASGFMIPHCSTPEKAQMIVDSMKFPPVGDRGLDGAGFDVGFTFDDPETFVADANKETFLVCQIETPEAVENAEAIAAIDGVDLLFVGPADLSLRLEHSETGATLDDAIETVRAAAAKHGKRWGITAGTIEDLTHRRELGASMIPWGGDFGGILAALRNSSGDLDQLDATGSK